MTYEARTVSALENEILKLQDRIIFLMEVFAARDTAQRNLIEELKEGVHRQNLTIIWLRTQLASGTGPEMIQ